MPSMKRFIRIPRSSQESALRESHEAGRFHTARVTHVIPAIPACPVRPKSGHSAKARVYEYVPYGAAENKSLEIKTLRPRLVPRVRDSTLVAWYRSIYAPRTGGAHDSHHRTAGVAGRARRPGGGVAGRCGRAAGRDAGDRVLRPYIAKNKARTISCHVARGRAVV